METGQLSCPSPRPCDLVVCRCGYNSIFEAMSGRSRVIVMPGPQPLDEGDPYVHALRLKRYYPIKIVNELSNLAECVGRELANLSLSKPPAVWSELRCNGLGFIMGVIFDDLGITGQASDHPL